MTSDYRCRDRTCGDCAWCGYQRTDDDDVERDDDAFEAAVDKAGDDAYWNDYTDRYPPPL